MILDNIDTGITNDDQVPGSIAFYKLDVLNSLHDRVKKIIEKETKIKLFKTYHYSRIYKNGAMLKPHFDRDACEISATINLGGDDWEIGIFDYNNVPHTYLLNPGDMLIYHGCDLTHWRPGKFSGNTLVQAFMHYVDQTGKRSYCKDDARQM